LNTVKTQLEKVIYTFIEFSNTTVNGNPILRHVIKASSTAAAEQRQLVNEIFQALSTVLPRVDNLITAELVAMSDSIIIQAVYVAIGPFFVAEAGGDSEGKSKKDGVTPHSLGVSSLRGLRLDALSLIRSVRIATKHMTTF
jgi:cohesin loading factor subunit SCC2